MRPGLGRGKGQELDNAMDLVSLNSDQFSPTHVCVVKYQINEETTEL